MAEEDKGGASDRDRRPEGTPASRPQPVTPPSAAPGWVVPPNLRRAPVIPGAGPALDPVPRPPIAPPPAPPVASGPPPAPSPTPGQAVNSDAAPSAPDSDRPAGAVEPRLDDRAAPPRLDETVAAGEAAEGAHEPRLGLVGDDAAPAGAPAAAEAKPRRWGRISPPLMARAAERVGGEERSRGRGTWVLILLLVLVIGGGVWLWREGRLGPIQTLIARIIPGSSAPSQTSAAATAAAGTSASAAATPPAAPAATTPGAATTTGTTDTGAATAAASPAIVPPAAAPAADQGAMITEIKQLLAKLDLAPGPIGGTMDAATENAIRSYQEMAGMPVDGQPSEALLRDLRAVVADQQPPAGG